MFFFNHFEKQENIFFFILFYKKPLKIKDRINILDN